VFVLNIF